MTIKKGYDDGNGPRVRGAVTLKTSRLAYSATLGFFIFAAALLCACGEDEYAGGPIGPVNANDPHPIWAIYNYYLQKYDQNGNVLLTVPAEPRTAYPGGVNPNTGDIWVTGATADDQNRIFIYDASGHKKKTIENVPYPRAIVFDSHHDRVWVVQGHDEAQGDYLYLLKFDSDGNLIFKKAAPPELGIDAFDAGVYEKTGEFWVAGLGLSHRVIFKFDPNGEPIFYKTMHDFGPSNYLPVQRIFVDQTDGAVWLADAPSNAFALKIGADGGFILRLDQPGGVLDVGRKTGNVLTWAWKPDANYLRMYTKSGEMIWQGPSTKQYYYGAINDFDGSCWVSYGTSFSTESMKKVSADGEMLADDIPTLERHFYVKRDPYPY